MEFLHEFRWLVVLFSFRLVSKGSKGFSDGLKNRADSELQPRCPRLWCRIPPPYQRRQAMTEPQLQHRQCNAQILSHLYKGLG